MTPEDRACAELTLRQVSRHGVFTRRMAHQAGWSESAVRHAIRTGRFRHLAGVGYADHDLPLGRSDDAHREARLRAIAASLTWPAGVICFRTAALLHRLPVRDDGLAHLCIAPGRRRGRRLAPHSFELDPSEICQIAGVAVTNRRRTIVDCLALLPYDEAESLMAWVRTRDLMSVDALKEAARARARKRGAPQLRRIVAETARGALSALERLLHQLLHSANLSGWRANHPIVVDGWIIARGDVVFERERVIIEVDGRAHHDFERDRERLNLLTLAGYTVLRFTWQQLRHRPKDVLRQIRIALSAAA
ncbi:DUF559 domain-containing protein [Bogoriella caseilytica]|uniref:Very-short-patch-repair endonuclease n=1 Tax=Bogoriella caseilytica TaxID=56055 RepID=A0A3N2BF29_9MICO|nr:DUF559 domain-containing protein [Bogoriella caseilytica]ROR73644.1 very-short-patch-repair endonuclease [Bogoriella caseilytica]